MISIIIPLYNKENYILQTVQSILNQSYKNYEIIIVDDGSTDRSYDIIKTISDPRIRLFRKKNEGVSITRNYGVSLSQYSYIAFLDADDFWEVDFLASIVDLINQYPTSAIFSTGYNIINQGIEEYINGTKGSKFIIQDYCKQVLYYNPICTGSIVIKKEAFNLVGGFQEYIRRGEDLDLWLKLASKYNIAYSAVAKVNYQKRSENNAMASYNSYKESMPYWDWYNYDYKPKDSLYKYTTLMILALAYAAYNFKKYDESIYILTRIRGRYKFIQRSILRVKLLIANSNKNLRTL